MTVGQRPGTDVIKSTSAALLQSASQRPSSMMITSASSAQVCS
jgi:hypothetical protein